MRRKKTPYKIPVSERATIQRLNRYLKRHNQKLFRARFWREGEKRYRNFELGRYYVIDLAQNCLVQSHVDLEAEAYRAGVLRSWERVRFL